MWEGLRAATQDESPRLPACTPPAANLMSQADCFSNCTPAPCEAAAWHFPATRVGEPPSFLASSFSAGSGFRAGGRGGESTGRCQEREASPPIQIGGLVTSCPKKKMFWGREGPTGSVKQRCSLTAVGCTLGCQCQHCPSTSIVWAGVGLNRGNKKYTLASQGNVMSLVKQVTGCVLQTEKLTGVTLKVCFFILIQFKFLFCFALFCFLF
jgi:hypothetical protein